MAQSEDVRAMIEHVRVKKADGTLYLMNERIAWMPNGKNTFTISHKYADIKTQKISPEGKPKIQLQIVLANGSDTFHFVNPKGQPAQLEDRNQVKEILQQMLPLFRRKMSQEMEQKWKVLVDNPTLYQLYKELVATNIISTDEFWQTYATRKQLSMKGIDATVGVSSAFLADVKPQSDGQNGIHYNITSEIIEAIFQTYPAVKRKHFECVPHKLTEQEFWQRFFQSHYFHRDRMTSMKDFFNDCAKQDEMDIQNAIKKGIIDPFFDIRVFDDPVEPTIENVLGSEATTSSANKPELSANKALIRRFNFHSIMVLDACRSEEERGYKDPFDYPHDKRNVKASLQAALLQQITTISSNWRPFSGIILDSKKAIQVVNDLSPGGILMKDASVVSSNLKDEIPKDIVLELKHLQMALDELLYHFWQCVPFSNQVHEKKFIEMKETLDRFHINKLQPFHDRVSKEYHRDLTSHLFNKLESAHARYNNWYRKKQLQFKN
ncbi:General transcription factor IIH subunit 1 [Dermatophagoides pteronyssinus]|uniref:General transcription factor IIH subunit 1 n=1 Tax=Dermatophagoides pteronyssinus TaxID=6956 RepID=A0ABQ8JPS4_DERPT|nr:General transcription factor IIH subunit 1 [Dermatophagoides pteronyssinus]